MPNDQPQSGALAVREEFGVSQTQRGNFEVASSAIAAQAKAMVESRYVMAMRRPRDWDQVRQSLLRECRRPSFARNKSAFYVKPIGDGVEGLGIRFVEVALRCMTNVLVETTMVFEDDAKEVHRVSVTDLESNLTYPQDVVVAKTVERSKPMGDGTFISVRANSYGKKVYTVTATDDDLLNKRAALISKAMRTIGLRIIPGDLQDEGESIIKQIRLDDAAQDPDAERKRIADAFASINVKASDLAVYLGNTLDACSPAQLVTLRGLYGAIKDGEATWKSVMDAHAEVAASKGADAPPAPPAPERKQPARKTAPATKTDDAAPDTGTADVKVASTLQPALGDPANSKASDGEKAYIQKQCDVKGVTVAALCAEVGIKSFDDLTTDGFVALRDRLAEGN